MTKCDCVCIPREEYEQLKGCIKAKKPRKKRSAPRKSAPRKPRATRIPKEVAIIDVPNIPIEEPILLPEKTTKVKSSKTKASKPKVAKTKKTVAKKPKSKKVTKPKASKPKTSKPKALPSPREESYERPLKYALPQIPYNGSRVERREKKVRELPPPRDRQRLNLGETKMVTSFRSDMGKARGYLQRRRDERREEKKLRASETRRIESPKQDRTIYIEQRAKELPGRREERLALPGPKEPIALENCDDLPYWQRRQCKERNRKRVE